MPYDQRLADRIRAVLASADQPPGAVTEKKMFGGLSFLVRGNMCCGVIKDELMARVGPDQHDDALAQPHARIMDFTGRPMEGWIMVGPNGVEADASLRDWVHRALRFAVTLPAK